MKKFINKFNKIKFIIPIIVGLLGLMALYKYSLKREIFLYFANIFLCYLWSKHWWKMARDNEYKKEREKWLSIPLLDRCNGRIRYEMLMLVIFLICSAAIIIAYTIFN